MQPYVFTGPWTETEADQVHQAMMRLGISGDVSPMFNQWIFSKLRLRSSTASFSGIRRTWKRDTICGTTAGELCAGIAKYYDCDDLDGTNA